MGHKKIVVGNDNNEVLEVKKGQECFVLKTSWYNHETWYLLEDIKTKKQFESPSIFWDEKK